MNKQAAVGSAGLAVYIAAIVGANYLLAHYGFIPIGFGLMAPAGVYAAAVTFPSRDLVQRQFGIPAGFAAIVVGASVTWLFSPSLAVASGVTFLLSETVDMLVYTPLRRRFGWAALASSLFSAAIDSLVFLRLAGIPYHVALAGQIVGKWEALVVAVPTIILLRRAAPTPSGAPA